MRAAIGVNLAVAAALAVAPVEARAASLTLESRIPLGPVKGRIDHLALDRDGRRLFVAELGNDSVGVVDLRAGQVTGRIAGLAEPQGVGWEPATRTLWVANAGDGSVRIFDGATLKPVGRIDLGDDADNVRIAGGKVYVGYGAGALAVIDPESRRVTSTLKLEGHPESFQIDQGQGKAFVNVPDRHEVDVLDLRTGATAARWDMGRFRANFPMALAPDGGGLAVVSRQPASLLRYGPGGASTWQASTCADADDVFFDARRERLYVTCGEGVVLSSADAKGAAADTVRTAPGARTSLFSPELDRLFVAAPARGGPAEIIVLKPTTE